MHLQCKLLAIITGERQIDGGQTISKGYLHLHTPASAACEARYCQKCHGHAASEAGKPNLGGRELSYYAPREVSGGWLLLHSSCQSKKRMQLQD